MKGERHLFALQQTQVMELKTNGVTHWHKLGEPATEPVALIITAQLIQQAEVVKLKTNEGIHKHVDVDPATGPVE